MIPRVFDPGTGWWLALAGWSVVVALWHTSAVALALATWRLWQRAASARAQYRAACVALAVTALLSVATPLALRWEPVRPTSGATQPLTASDPGAFSTSPAPFVAPEARWSMAAASIGTRAVPWLGALWCAGVLVSLLRFAGGWGLAHWIRRRATPLDAPHLVDAVAGASAQWCLPPAVLLASAHVDAPVVVGAREPAILLPVDLEHHLDAAALPPLLAHELAHVARRDYAANVLQSFVEALLFFSPGLHWISRQVREAREYCCDDLVVDRCGPRPYVEALTSLAGLGAAAGARPVLNVAGPRLIARVRRLLQEDDMIPFARVRIAGWTAALAATAAIGLAVVPLAAGQVGDPHRAYAWTAGRIPLAFPMRQPGSSVTLRSVVESPEMLCGTAVVRNDADRAVTSLQFVGALTAIGPRSSGLMALSDRLDVRIEPGEEATVSPNVVPQSEARWRMAQSRIQVVCGLVGVQFENGFFWSLTPNPAATTAEEMLGLPRIDLPRTLVGQPAGPNPSLCVDEAEREYSQGAIIAIRNEPGRFGRCEAGAWVDYALPGLPSAAR